MLDLKYWNVSTVKEKGMLNTYYVGCKLSRYVHIVEENGSNTEYNIKEIPIDPLNSRIICHFFTQYIFISCLGELFVGLIRFA